MYNDIMASRFQFPGAADSGLLASVDSCGPGQPFLFDSPPLISRYHVYSSDRFGLTSRVCHWVPSVLSYASAAGHRSGRVVTCKGSPSIRTGGLGLLLLSTILAKRYLACNNRPTRSAERSTSTFPRVSPLARSCTSVTYLSCFPRTGQTADVKLGSGTVIARRSSRTRGERTRA